MQVIGTAGHVDHGKSTLVQTLTGIDPDRFAEEKRRGLTIDLGFAWLKLPSGTEVGIVDVPGHERFIKNMLAGAGGITAVLFVVDAAEGWKPQSAEHLEIIEILGLSAGVVAVTKTDAVDAETLELSIEEVRERLASSVLQKAPIVGVSAVTGAGMDGLVAALDRTVAALPAPVDQNAPRMWIDRVFTIAGSGTVVTGTLMAGSLRVGQEVEISPARHRARVRTIQSHKTSHEAIGPGHRVALNLVGLDKVEARRGDAVVLPNTQRVTHTIDVMLTVPPSEIAGTANEISERGAHLFYAGTAETAARVTLLEGPRVRAGESAVAQIHLQDALPLRAGDRFVLRDAGPMLTLGGGVILDPLADRARRKDESRALFLHALHSAEPRDKLELFLDRHGSLDVEEAATRSGVIRGDVPRLGSRLYSHSALDELEARARGLVLAHHEEQPLSPGIPREELRDALALDPAGMDDLLRGLDDVRSDGRHVALASFGVALSDEQSAARADLLQRLDAAHYEPPLREELIESDELLRALERAGDLVRIRNFFLTSALAQAARATVRSAIESEGPITVARVRDLLGTSRKYAVPLCEWLDDTGATIRQGDLRHLGPNP